VALLDFAEQGLRCLITLPLADSAVGNDDKRNAVTLPASATPAARPLDIPRKPEKRILVIEDEVLLAMDMEFCLAEAGWRVVGTAGTVEGAKRIAAAGCCDAALLDANLGGRPVDDIAASLARQHIPFAFVTGYGRDALPTDFRAAPMVGKPFSREQSLAVVQALLDRGRATAAEDVQPTVTGAV
jgi:DNA-binding response OmpR family regulator